MRKVILFALLASLASCSFFKNKKDTDRDVIARVNDEYLYASDLNNITKGLSGPDSVTALKTYADSWVRKKLLLKKADDYIDPNDPSFTQKVEEYRESLILYEYEKALIDQKLDTAVNEAQLNEWYDKMKNDFLLDDDVYQVYFIKLKKDAPELKDARQWITKPRDEEDNRKLLGYCKEFAISYSLDKPMWFTGDNLLKTFSLSNYEMGQLGNKFSEFTRSDEIWFIKSPEIRKKGEPSPPEFVRAQLVKLIVEKRKMELLEKTYNKIYQDGIESKTFEINVK